MAAKDYFNMSGLEQIDTGTFAICTLLDVLELVSRMDTRLRRWWAMCYVMPSVR